jgi:hypothetical protein
VEAASNTSPVALQVVRVDEKKFRPVYIAASGMHCIGGWVGPRDGLDFIKKSKHFWLLPEIEPGLLGDAACRLIAVPTELSRQFIYYRELNPH